MSIYDTPNSAVPNFSPESPFPINRQTLKNMATIIHDPTRGWLLLTEKWPIAPTQHSTGEYDTVEVSDYRIAINHCLSTAIEIAKEDWDEIKWEMAKKATSQRNEAPLHCLKLKEWIDSFCDKDHHPYSVDAEFEVKRQFMETGCNPPSKWVDLMDGDSTSSCGGRYDYRKIARLVKAKEDIDVVATMTELMNPKPTESQDESQHALLDELLSYVEKGEPFEKRFRIERI